MPGPMFLNLELINNKTLNPVHTQEDINSQVKDSNEILKRLN